MKQLTLGSLFDGIGDLPCVDYLTAGIRGGRTMNLYAVYPQEADWCCYVFAPTRNQARAWMVGHFDNSETYIDFGARLIAKDTGGLGEICEENCSRLERLGVRYLEEIENE